MPHLTNGKRYPPEPLDREEVYVLIRACRGTGPLAVRNRALIVLLWRSGLRISEALTLRPSDIDEREGTLRVRTGKGKNDRVAVIDTEALAYVRAWLEVRRRIITVVKLREGPALAVKNAAGECNQDLDQRQRSGNQSATQQCGAGGGNVVVARAHGSTRVRTRTPCKGTEPCNARAGRARKARKREARLNREARAKGIGGDDQYCGIGGCPGGNPDQYCGVSGCPGGGGGSGGGPGPRSPYPLRGSTWMQGRNETDQFVGEAVWSGCPAALVELFVDGRRIGEAHPTRSGRRTRESFGFSRSDTFEDSALFEVDRPVRRTLSATVSSGCSDEPVTVHSLKVNVLGFRNVTNRLHDLPCRTLHGVPQEGVVAFEGRLHAALVVFPELGAALDVSEEESERSRRRRGTLLPRAYGHAVRIRRAQAATLRSRASNLLDAARAGCRRRELGRPDWPGHSHTADLPPSYSPTERLPNMSTLRSRSSQTWSLRPRKLFSTSRSSAVGRITYSSAPWSRTS